MKSIVLFSGGLDSATCLSEAINRHGSENVIALSVYYGQKHKKELEAAKKLTDHYSVKWEQIDLTKVFEGSKCSLMADSNKQIPQGSYSEQIKETSGRPVDTYVPFMNGLFISCAAVAALKENCELIYCGIHRDDAAGNVYPDCSEEFAKAVDTAVCAGTGGAVRVFAPFVGNTKAEIVKRGLELGVPYELTWSCYEGAERPCGKCGTCIDRQKAFEANGRRDPLYD